MSTERRVLWGFSPSPHRRQVQTPRRYNFHFFSSRSGSTALYSAPPMTERFAAKPFSFFCAPNIVDLLKKKKKMDEWRQTPTPLYNIQEVGPFPRPRLAATFSPSPQEFSTTPESVRFSAYRDPRQQQCRVERSRKRRCCVVVGKLVFLAEKRATTTVQFASICRNWGGSRYGQAAGRRGPMIRREVFAPAKCVLFLLNVHSFDDASRWSKTSWWTLSCEIITNNKFCYEKCKLTPLHGTKSALNQPYGLHLPFHFTRKAIPATLVQKSARFEVGVINISPFHPASKNETRVLHAVADLVQTQKTKTKLFRH